VISEVRVVDPCHALCGERLTLLSLVCARGPKYIAVRLADGRRRLLPRAATDLDQPALAEPDVPRISARTLLPLARLVRRMLAASQEETSHAEPNPPDPSLSCAAGGATTPVPDSATALAGPAAPGPDAAGAAPRPAAAASAPGRRGGAPC